MQTHERLLWQQDNVPFADTPSLAKKIADELCQHDYFCLWLKGNIGAGKTSITGEILRALGLPQDRAVTSPTFTYLSDYKLNKKAYGHLDFYRLDSGQHPIADLLSYMDYDGLFIEWPENLGSDLSQIMPTHILQIEKGSDLSSRNYLFYAIS